MKGKLSWASWERATSPGSHPRHVITVNAPKPLYALEVDDMAAVIFDGAPPAVPEADSLGNMKVLDQLRREIGVLG